MGESRAVFLPWVLSGILVSWDFTVAEVFALVARLWHDPENDEGPAWEETPPEPALLAVPPAGFEPATPALGERCSIP